MKNQKLKTLFNRYLEKKASPDEVKLLLDYFHLEKESALLLEMILQEIERYPENDNVISLNEHNIYARVENALNTRIDQEQRTLGIPFWRKPMFRFAASIAAVLLIISSYVLWTNSRPIAIRTVYAGYGKQVQIQLPDSSKVWLNAGTTITYPEAFKGNVRSIVLKNGEAYFDIVHDPLKPFVVKTGEANVTVLGTSFEISTFDKEAKITVNTGKVGVQLTNLKQPATFVLPGERAIVVKANHAVRKIKVALSDIAAWREQRLIFDNQPLAEVLQSLERKYNVHIEIQNPHLLSEKISMRLNNQPLTDVLTAISFANHFNYTRINEQLIVVK